MLHPAPRHPRLKVASCVPLLLASVGSFDGFCSWTKAGWVSKEELPDREAPAGALSHNPCPHYYCPGHAPEPPSALWPHSLGRPPQSADHASQTSCHDQRRQKQWQGGEEINLHVMHLKIKQKCERNCTDVRDPSILRVGSSSLSGMPLQSSLMW